MSGKTSSRRVDFCQDEHATAAKRETLGASLACTSHGANINRSTQAAQREREARARIQRQREQQQAARYFYRVRQQAGARFFYKQGAGVVRHV